MTYYPVEILEVRNERGESFYRAKSNLFFIFTLFLSTSMDNTPMETYVFTHILNKDNAISK